MVGSGEKALAKPVQPKCKSSKEAIVFYRGKTWYWQNKQGISKSLTSYSERWSRSCLYLRWVSKLWQKRSYKARLGYHAYLRRVSSDPRWLGRQMASKYGWINEQWFCLEHLWGPLEGSWNVYADNPHSDAYGIPQALPGSKMGPGWQHSAYVQIKWGLGYIAGRYGNPCNARSFRLSNGWY